MSWQDFQYVGFAVKSMKELHRMKRIGATVAEIKLDKFAKSGHPVYFYKDGYFTLNVPVIEQIAKFAKINNIRIQWHLPIEGLIDVTRESGLNMGIIAHHDIIIERFVMFEWILHMYGIGHCVTVHPPTVSVDGEMILAEEETLINTKMCLDRLDIIRIQCDHNILIGVENQTDIKQKAGNLGYMPFHFRRMMKDTRTIGITIDTGHRRLTQEFSIREFLQGGWQVMNFHFHGNEGIFDPKDWSDDQHLLPHKENVKGYDNYLRYFRRHRVPIILEISWLNKYTDRELIEFLIGFREELQ